MMSGIFTKGGQDKSLPSAKQKAPDEPGPTCCQLLPKGDKVNDNPSVSAASTPEHGDPFAPATVSGSWLRLALIGPSKAGKTYSALSIATGLVPGGKIALIDTEHGTASKYADRFSFRTIKLRSFEPERYEEAIRAAVKFGYDVLIIDSLSHAWAGKGGILSIVDERKRRAKNKWTEPWGEATPRHLALIETILQADIHIIATMRAKTDWSQREDGKVVKVGLAPIQRDGMEYEFDIEGYMEPGNTLRIGGSRYYGLVEGQEIEKPGEALGEELATWLAGEKPEPIPLTPAPPVNMGEKSLLEMSREEFGEAFNARLRSSGLERDDLERKLGRSLSQASRAEWIDALDALISDQEAELPFGEPSPQEPHGALKAGLELPDDIAQDYAKRKGS